MATFLEQTFPFHFGNASSSIVVIDFLPTRSLETAIILARNDSAVQLSPSSLNGLGHFY